MGGFWVLFAGKPVSKLEKMKAKRQEKVNELTMEINAIDKEIAKQKSAK